MDSVSQTVDERWLAGGGAGGMARGQMRGAAERAVVRREAEAPPPRSVQNQKEDNGHHQLLGR